MRSSGEPISAEAARPGSATCAAACAPKTIDRPAYPVAKSAPRTTRRCLRQTRRSARCRIRAHARTHPSEEGRARNRTPRWPGSPAPSLPSSSPVGLPGHRVRRPASPTPRPRAPATGVTTLEDSAAAYRHQQDHSLREQQRHQKQTAADHSTHCHEARAPFPAVRRSWLLVAGALPAAPRHQRRCNRQYERRRRSCPAENPTCPSISAMPAARSAESTDARSARCQPAARHPTPAARRRYRNTTPADRRDAGAAPDAQICGKRQASFAHGINPAAARYRT